MKINFLDYELLIDLDTFCSLQNSGKIEKIDNCNRTKSEIEILQDRINELMEEQNKLKLKLLDKLFELEEININF
jgi:hypothetical protein